MKKNDILLFFLPMLISCAANSSRLMPITEPVRHHKAVCESRSFDKSPGIAYIAVVVTEDSCRRTTIYVDYVKLGTVQEKSITYFPVPLGGHHIIAHVGSYYFIDSVFLNDNDTIFFKANSAANWVSNCRLARVDGSRIPEGMRTNQDLIRNDSIFDRSPLNYKRYKRLLCHYRSGNTAVPARRPPYAIGFRLGAEYTDVFGVFGGGMDQHIAFYRAFLPQVRLGVQFDHHKIRRDVQVTIYPSTYYADIDVNGYEIFSFFRAALPIGKVAFFAEPGIGYYRGSGRGPVYAEKYSYYAKVSYHGDKELPFSKNAVLLSIIGGMKLFIFDIHWGYKKAFGAYSYHNVGISYDCEFKTHKLKCDQ